MRILKLGTFPYLFLFFLSHLKFISIVAKFYLRSTKRLSYPAILKSIISVVILVFTSGLLHAQTVTLTPTADAYVRNGTYANTNYGSADSLTVKGSPTSGFTRTSYLKFSLGAVTNVHSAKLRLYGLNIDNTTTIYVAVFGVSNDSWTESGITFNNAPAATPGALSYTGVNNVAGYYEFDITSFVQTELTGDEIVSVVIKDTTTKNLNVQFNSKENSANPPQLVIDTTTGSQATSNALLFVENPDKFPSNDHFVFSHIQIPWKRDSGVYNANHDSLRVRIHNNGISSLVISNLSISNSASFKIDKFNGANYNPSSQLPVTVSSGNYLDLMVKFIAQNAGTRAAILHETLTITSNDDINPVKKVYLDGLWQHSGEGVHEPYAQEVLTTFGFKTSTGFGFHDPDKGDSLKIKGDEIKPDYFLRADPSFPVSVRQVASYHGCCYTQEYFKWFYKGTSSYTTLFTVVKEDGQSLLGRKSLSNGGTAASGTFTPTTTPFGFNIGSLNTTDPNKNPGKQLGTRVYKALDGAGNIIPNTYFLDNDYLGSTSTNYDYNDNILYVTNIKPYFGTIYNSPLNTAPSDIDFGEKVLQTSNSFTLNISSGGKVYSNGTQDPQIVISSIAVTGDNKSEFSATMPSKTTLNPQEATSINVKFNPTSQGLKVADLLIYYNNSLSPKRVPLYGIAKPSGVTVTANYRVNSGASSSITINGKTWAADNQYSFDNLEPYKNSALTQIAGTDEDALYLDEQSSNGDKKPFRYEFPVANGTYYVRLHFAEIYWGAPGNGLTGGAGSRVFSVKLENQYRLINFDLSQAVGAATAIIKNFPVTVTDGKLNIDFSAVVNRPMVSAVEVYHFSNGNSVTPDMVATTALPNLAVAPPPENISGYDFQKPGIYPNPLRDNFTLQFPEKYQGIYHIQLMDMIGRRYDLGETRINTGGSRMNINIAKLALKPGVYFLRINSTADKADVLKLMIQ